MPASGASAMNFACWINACLAWASIHRLEGDKLFLPCWMVSIHELFNERVRSLYLARRLIQISPPRSFSRII